MRNCVANWEPLRLILEDDSVEEFMFMGCVAGPGGVILFLYKHYGNRVYVRLDAEGRLYKWQADSAPLALGTYSEIALEDALAIFAKTGWPLKVKDPRRLTN